MKRNIIAMAIVLALFGCNASNKNESADAVSAETVVAPQDIEGAVAQKIIKTADMRFRVRDVQNTKETLSKTIHAEGGTITEFSVESTIQETEKVKISADSLKEITAYRTEGYVIAKIPTDKLDAFTNSIAKMSVFVNTQSMKMDDQSIQYLANKIKSENRLDAAKQMQNAAGKKTNTIDRTLGLKDEALDKRIDNLTIDSKVKYSTLTLNFYQDNTIKTAIIANDNLSDYRPSFGNRLWLNIVNGWTIFKEIFLALVNIWLLVLTGVAAFFIIRHFVRKSKLTAQPES
ncbi:DUF4349 domain-containing protein [Pedobacter sp. AW1-32]|uniref:DUF4349 domain-containing protein n=1 Tax=Pedobacter sp. AW1-32 TaxID=3383026 RepID=UPI003FEEE598